MTDRQTARTSLRTATFVVLALTTPSFAQEDWTWLTADVPREQVTEALNYIWTSSAPEAAEIAETVHVLADQASGANRHRATLLMAVALERAGGGDGAAAYKQVVDSARGTPYAVSAFFRERQLAEAGDGVEALKEVYATFAEQPPAEGWFLSSDVWSWGNRQQAALTAQMDLKADRLSVRFFQYLRSRAPFAPAQAYLFILLALTLGVKFLELPLYHRSVESSGQSSLLLVDMIFVIWAFNSLESFEPQLKLDGASFWWISDVTRWDFRVTLAWAVVVWIVDSVLTVLYRPGSTAPKFSFPVLIFYFLFVGLAWLGKWPTYLFLFAMLLAIAGLLVEITLRKGLTPS